MFDKAYRWVVAKAAHPKADWILGILSFMESSLSPIPPDPLIIPMILAKPKRAWFLAGLCTATSVLGGALGYAIGYFVFEKIGFQILEFYHLMGAFEKLQHWFNAYGFWIIVIKGMTPIPYKVVTITSGVTQLNFWTFMLASVIARGIRFYAEAWLIWKYGKRVQTILEKNITLWAVLFIALLVGGFIVIKYLV